MNIGVKLQYISQGKSPQEHLQRIGEACEAGVRWVQLRLKNVEAATLLHTALKCREICDQYGAIMIVNDNVSVAKASQADGVHLGLQDMSPVEARNIVGDNYIIGGTANTLQDCLQQVQGGVDYIGLGPYKHTTTKKNLSPVLGLKGYCTIIQELRSKDIQVPVIAIGGITSIDVKQILETGVSGIAVSGMLTKQSDLEEKIKSIKEVIVSDSLLKS